MIKLSTTARLRYADNQKTLFKADFTLNKEHGRNASIMVEPLDGKNLNYGETKEYLSQHSNSSIGFYLPTYSATNNWNCNFKNIPISLFKQKKYVVVSMEVKISTPSNIEYIRPYLFDIFTDNTSYKRFGKAIDTPLIKDTWIRVYQVVETAEYLRATILEHIDCMGVNYVDSNHDIPSTPFTDIDYSFRNVMFELNDTGVPSPYVDSYVYYGGDYSDFFPHSLRLRGFDVMNDSVSFSDGVSSSGNFDVGSAIISSLNVTLNNYDDKFSLYDFSEATMKIFLGVPLVDEVTDEDDITQVEWVQKGFYTVDKPTSIGNTIPLTMLDNMSKFEVSFKDFLEGSPATTFPTTIGTLIQNMCNYCKVVLGSTVTHPEWVINKAPEEDLTCLDVIRYLAQINCNYAKINRDGYLIFNWYSADAFGQGDGTNLDGGTYLTKTTPYSDGDNADGGAFEPPYDPYIDEDGRSRLRYHSGDDYDAGVFNFGDYSVLRNHSNFSIGTDQITITGVKVEVENKDENSEERTLTYLIDKQGIIPPTDKPRIDAIQGYIINISDNKLMPYLDDLNACLEHLGLRLTDFTFRPFNVTSLSNIAIESGDAVRVYTPKGDFYDTYVTILNFKVNGFANYICDAKSVNENSSKSTSPLTSAIDSVKNDTKKQISVYSKAVENLTSLGANALGFYETSEIDPLDGTRIDYMHDKPKLEDSLNGYKKSLSGFFTMTRATTSDPWTLISGVTLDGSAVVKVLTANGINADWINAGTITGRNINGSYIYGNTRFEMNAYGSGQDTNLNWGGTWADSLTVVVNSNAEAGLGVAHASNRYKYAVYVHYNDIRLYDDSYNPDYAQWGSKSSSDKRLKKNIKNANKKSIRELFKKLRFVSFNYKDDDTEKTEHGMIAQEVEPLIEELGFDKRAFIKKDDKGYYKLTYPNFERLSMVAIQDLYDLIEKQQKEIDELKSQLKK